MVNAQKIRELMQARGVQNKELADAIGVSEPMMSYIARGLREPSVHYLARIAAKLGCTVDELIIKEGL